MLGFFCRARCCWEKAELLLFHGVSQGKVKAQEKPMRAKPAFSELSEMFREAVEEGKKLDVGEPPLVWPDLPEHLKNNPKAPAEKDESEG